MISKHMKECSMLLLYKKHIKTAVRSHISPNIFNYKISLYTGQGSGKLSLHCRKEYKSGQTLV